MSAPYPSMASAYQRRPEDGSPDGVLKKKRKGAVRLSCAECRRLKLRCDRQIPCSSCVKRGCGQICPDGSLTTGQGNRFVLASTQELHEKISELSQRVRELEDGLRSAYGQLTNEQHPLLTEELLRVKAPLQREVPSLRTNLNGNHKEEEPNPDVVDAFGSLSIGLSGRAKYFGQIANSWYFLQNENEEDENSDDQIFALQEVLPQPILARAAAFPISNLPPYQNDKQVTVQSLYWLLPPEDVASRLRTVYYTHAAWMYNPIPQEAFDFEVYHQLYNPTATPPANDDLLMTHRLSLMFIVLAIGSLMDTSQPAYSLEAEKYNQLARAALFQDSFFDTPTVHAVQALLLMTYYLFLGDRHGTGSGARWALMGIAVKVAQSIGLHRDSGKFPGVDPAETLRRRQLFWELYTYDSWQCLTFGRPPSFALPHLDCKMPYASDNGLGDENSFHGWKHRFASECMSFLHDQAFGAKTPTYATVLQLDRKLRAFPVPPILQVAGFGSSDPRAGQFPDSVTLILQRHIVLAIREMNLLYLHRSFFARAITDHPKDPLGSPYGTSVIAAYRSAGSLVALMRNLHTQLKEPSERIWFLWTHMFSCAIVLGSIVTRSPSMSFAPSALVQLDSACDLFAKTAPGFRAERVFNIMNELRHRAHSALNEFRQGRGSPVGLRQADSLSPTEDNDELAMLGGKSRLVKKEPSSPPLQLIDRSPTTMNPIVPLPLSPSNMNDTVVEYLGSFQPQQQQNHTQHQYADVDISPVSMYGMSSSSGSSFGSFHHPADSGASNYLTQTQQSPVSLISPHLQQPDHVMTGMNGQSQQQSFPQYFPVYDYSAASMDTSGAEYGSTAAGVPILDSHPMPGHGPQRRSSTGSPEGNNLNTTWMDFVQSMR